MQNLSKKLLRATIVLITSVAVLLGVSTPSVKADTDVVGTFSKLDGSSIYTGGDVINYGDVLTVTAPQSVLINGSEVSFGPDQQYVMQSGLKISFGARIELFKLNDDILYRNLDFEINYGDVITFSKPIMIKYSDDSQVNFGPDFQYVNQNGVRITTSSIESVPAISGEHTVINNIDSPYTLERIKQIAELKATDAYYGDLTNDIEVIRDEYTPNKSTVGTFEIEYQVTNDFGLSANFILLVSNKDLTKPVISGPGTSTISYTEDFVLSNLIAKFTVTDNYDTNVKLELESTTHVPGVPGIYIFKFFAKDSSNNIATFNHTLTIVDDVKPTIIDTNEGVIQVNWRDQVTNEILLMHLTAHDAIDGDLTSSIQVIENNLKNEVGNYTVKYQVTDSAGNSGLYTRTYKVVTTDAPVFWVSANLLLISEVNTLTNQQLADELASYEGINMASHMMILNEYEGNENVPGTYMVRMAINDTQGEEHIVERTIEVFADDELPELELSFWKKALNVIISIWDFIVKVFTWIWNAIKWIFNFVFGWIN